jgi:hypothetical protein
MITTVLRILLQSVLQCLCHKNQFLKLFFHKNPKRINQDRIRLEIKQIKKPAILNTAGF